MTKVLSTMDWHDQYIPPIRDDACVPLSMFIGKSEETDYPMVDTDAYQRQLLMSVAPEKALFEHEKRRDTKVFDEKLKLRYEGHRGEATPWTEGQFTGILNTTDEIGSGLYKPNSLAEGYEPRGAAGIHPDKKELVKQAKARTRFIRLTAENDKKDIGDTFSPAAMISMRQITDQAAASRMKIFDRMLETMIPGRQLVPGTNEVLRHIDKEKSISYNPDANAFVHRGGRKKTQDLLYREAISDQDFAVAYYGASSRRARRHPTQSANPAAYLEQDELVDITRMTKQFTRMMKQLTSNTADAQNMDKDGEFGSSDDTRTYRHAVLKNTMVAILMQAQQQDRGTSSLSAVRRHSVLRSTGAGQYARQNTADDRIIQQFQAAAIARGLKPGADKSLVKRDIAYMTDLAQSMVSSDRKTATPERFRTGKNTVEDMTRDGSEDHVIKYKSRARRGLPSFDKKTIADYLTDGRNTKVGRTPNAVHRRAMDGEDVDSTGQEFYENHKLDRHIGRIGGKQVHRYQDEDTVVEDFGDSHDHSKQ